MTESLAHRVSTLKPTAVNQVLQEVRQMQKAGRSLVSLMRGQPDSPTPAFIIEAAERALRDGRTGYPDNRGEPGLRQAVAEKLARDNSLQYDPDGEILITDGATCGIATALGALVEPGCGVMLPDPIYDAYESVIALWGARAVRVPATIEAGRFVIEPTAWEQSWSAECRVMLLNSPWNPVGSVFTGGEWDAVLRFAADKNLTILSDEIYEALIYDGKKHVSPAGLSEDARGRTVLVNSLSKTYAMTGWRVGYCAGPAELIRSMLLVLQQFSRGPATFVQDAAAAALRSTPAETVQPMVTEYAARRDQVMRALQGIPRVEPLAPGGGLFVMVDVRGLGKASNEVRRFLLEEAGVVVVHGAAYGARGEGTLRVSFASGGETLAKGLERLREGLIRLGNEK